MKSSKFFPAFFFFAVVLACSCSGKPEQKAVVASVNNSPILLSDLQKELNIHDNRDENAKMTPEVVEDQLKTMIDQKLMLQEAMKLKLYKSEHFEQTIRQFREQTLIRELIKAKNREWENKLTASDDEIELEYRRMGYRAVIRATRVPDRTAAEKLVKKIRRGEQNSCDMRGPCYYEEVRLTPLGSAFDMNVGDVKIVPSEDEFIVILVEGKQRVALAPLKTMRPQLKRSILEQKQQKALADWLESVKQSSKIKIDRNLITKAIGTRETSVPEGSPDVAVAGQ